MKRFIFTILFLIAGLAIYAQDGQKSAASTDGMKTLFGNGKPVKLGWFAAFDPGYTTVNGHGAFLGGFSGGMIIDHNFSVGLVARGWHNGYQYENFSDTSSAMLVGGYGGLLLEYTLFPKSLVHVTFPVIIGGGGAAYVESQDMYYGGYHNNHDMKVYDNDSYFVFEPGVRAEVNVLKFMRVNAGISYRLISGLHLKNTPSDKLSSFNFTMGLKFGKF